MSAVPPVLYWAHLKDMSLESHSHKPGHLQVLMIYFIKHGFFCFFFLFSDLKKVDQILSCVGLITKILLFNGQ